MAAQSKNVSSSVLDAVSPGLENIVAAQTVLSHVDGAAGRLILRGYDLDSLSDWSFEAVLALLWKDLAPNSQDAVEIRAALAQARTQAFALVEPLLATTEALSHVEALRLFLSSLADAEPGAHHIMAVAAVPVFAAAIARKSAGLAPIAPNATLGHAADFLHMLHGVEASPEKVRALDTYLVTVADHGLNASTFTARVIASTKAGMFSSVIGALCALKGPLHGGAPGPVLDMLDAIGDDSNIHAWLVDALARGERLMGFGHRIYRVRDPRADVLKKAVGALRNDSDRISFAEAVEKEALSLLAEKKPLRPLQTNVEFYTALVLEGVGFPRESFTNVFAAGRMAGWTAHVLEQDHVGKLIRPQSHYIGPMPR
ncbi:citrate synthase/methylcitrate synthase [Agrobacterium rubi]|uniref:citrate synthase/methylcitrate synthase n=1 Tax=Agrobacterium rubi TaxID=28099 RepID=UPI00157384BD|nr:citrate synthase/methylcitrate synthase [Agrobacterium rubi]NTF10019.1 citrate synthase/methylcitrate synthase [Agrobacterium rubi]NTF21803.1 citrate synthase/methylcitrate synthase [Agrobacterium rubi]NTF28660.1 citrate synthase/methylcitrate synthase [Agrobacterium rubi]